VEEEMKKLLIAMGTAALLLGLLAVVSGCGTQASADGASQLSPEKYAQINDGMTADQVKAIAGEPSKTEQKTTSGGHQMSGMTMDSTMSTEYWYYQGSKGWVRLELADGKLSSKSGY
jgi:tetrahydromethanopterin S-methyltransferase subunit E